MWLSFCISFLVVSCVAIIPGFIVCRIVGCPNLLSFACSVPASAFLLTASGTLLGAASLPGIAPLALASLTILFIIGLIAYVLRSRQNNSRSALNDFMSPKTLLLFLIMAAIIVTASFLKNIGGLDSYIQFDDNHSHLAWIRSMADSGNYSILSVSAYSLDDPLEPFQGGTYYPAGFHILAAIALSIYPTVTSIAENATICIFLIVCYSSGICALLSKIFGGDDFRTKCGAFVMMASTAFPLRMLTVHGPFPNIAGFSCVPIAITLFILLFEGQGLSIVKRNYVAPLLIVSCGVAFLHPNALIFSVLGMLSYWLVVAAPRIGRSLSKVLRNNHYPILSSTKILVAILELLSILFAIILWCLLHQSSFMSGVVSFIWEWTGSFNSVFGNIINGGFLLGIPQFAFGVIITIGLFVCFKENKEPWVGLFFLLIVAIFAGTAFCDAKGKSWISGFWYTDPERLAAMLAIAAVPVASIGLNSMISLLAHNLERRSISAMTKYRHSVLPVFWIIVFVALNYYPFYLYDGATNQTSFGQTFYELRSAYSGNVSNPYSDSERSFVKEVKEVAGDDLVINLPSDGSSFAYSIDELNLYYHAMSGTNETNESKIIRQGLNAISDNSAVKQAVKDIGAKYVMLLDRSEFTIDGSTAYSTNLTFNASSWGGIMDINDTTPGFEKILFSDNMRLYRILY